MGTLVDTNVFLAAISEEDSLHERANAALEKCEKPYLIHEYVLVEATNILMARKSKETADKFLTTVLTNSSVQILHSTESIFFMTSYTFLGIKTKQLSFVDCALLGLSQQYPVLTFDEALNRAIKKASTSKDLKKSS